MNALSCTPSARSPEISLSRPLLTTMDKSLHSYRRYYFATFALMLVFFGADLLLPRGATPAIGYCLVLVVAVGARRPGFSIATAVACSLLTWTGYFLEPIGAVWWMSAFDRAMVTALRDREALVVRDEVIPTVHLRDLIAARAGSHSNRRPTVILEVGERRAALVVDALVGQQDIVVEPFDAPRGLPSFVGGATILADGAPALILDAAALL